MTAPTINGTRYPQPVDELLPKARELAAELGTMPSRNRLMREFRIGAPKAEELRGRLIEEQAREIVTREHEAHLRRRLADQFGYTPPDERGDEPATDPWDYAEPSGLNPGPPAPAPAADPGTDPLDIALDDTPEPDQTEALRGYPAARGSLMAPRTDPADTRARPTAEPAPEPAPAPPAAEPDEQVTTVGHPGTPTPAKPARRAVAWPIVLLALPAFVAIWGGWVGLGGLTGFGKVNLLPGIVKAGSWATIDSAITLPIGVETYGAYALYIWLSGRVPPRARRFAKWSAIASLVVGALGQVAYHLLVAAGVTSAPWQITALVACLPVAVLGMGAALAHLVREDAR